MIAENVASEVDSTKVLVVRLVSLVREDGIAFKNVQTLRSSSG